MAAIVLASAAHAQSEQPSLDELLNLQPDAPATQPAEPESAPESEQSVPLDPAVQRRLEEQPSDAADVFLQAVREMDEASLRLGRERDAGLETQRLQQSILDRLDQTIAAARQQQQQSSSGGGGGGGGSPSQARQQDSGGEQVAQQGQQQRGQQGQAQGAQAAAGNAHSGEASPGQVQDVAPREQMLEELRREWGNLPPRLRDEISEGLQERFSPIYRSLTEAYYQRLAEEQ